MIRIWILLFVFLPELLLGQSIRAQLDTSAIGNWQSVVGGQMSNDHNWVAYGITKNSDRAENEIVIAEISGKKKYRFIGAGSPSFSTDSRHAIFNTNKELHVLRLGDDKPQIIAGTKSFELVNTGMSNYLLYDLISDPGKLFIKELANGKVKVFENVKERKVINHKLLITKARAPGIIELRLVDLKQSKEKLLWAGSSVPSNLVISGNVLNLAFITGTKIWLCDLRSGYLATELLMPTDSSLNSLTLVGIRGFDSSINSLVLAFRRYTQPNAAEHANLIHIFSYQDRVFDLPQSESVQPSYCNVAYNLSTHQLNQLNDESGVEYLPVPNSDLVVINKQKTGESYWNKKQNGFFIKNLATGIQLGNDYEDAFVYGVFDQGRSIIYQQSSALGNIYNLNVVSGEIFNLTEHLPIPLVDNLFEALQTKESRGLEFVGRISFQSSSNYLLVYDRYDVWLIDAWNKAKPVCLTGGYGRANHIKLRLIDGSLASLMKEQKLYLKAFSEITKEAGFYLVNWKDLSHPTELSMGPYIYTDISGSHGTKKAGNVDRWLVSREGASESANLFWTNDFRNFHPVSDVRPEKKYNWFTTELINYTTRNGVKSQAILYKPDNLNPKKKYPVLFNFYEQESFKLNKFLIPDYTSNYYFNIPIMLSRGYIVCVPDIHFTIGETAASIVDCVEGAADAIATRPYIDSTKYGAAGGSFGGYGVNCLAAYSCRFKALVSISGVSDLIGQYGNVPGLRDEEVENRQMRMGVSLSRAPLKYLENSPVANAKDVSAPLLIVIGKNDVNVNVQQGIEWFISLRREGKPSWLIHYNNTESNHGIWGEDQIDLYVRMNHFFDNFLKDAPTPMWMMDNLSIRKRSGREGIILMPPGVHPGIGLNTGQDLQNQKNYLSEKNQLQKHK